MEKKKQNKSLDLNFIWKYRCSLWNKGTKLQSKAKKLWIKNNNFTAKNNKLRAEARKFWAESDKLYAEADILWTSAVLEVYGNIEMEWKNLSRKKQDYECHLENGEVFKP
ncbi:MAG: hypothetical protein BWY51_00927 [Parcubacteria group bacterium ADurb.Bin316]|nr:MAG: hypothetical protein BWY51_00927 [Parcubacteria group bacterium ADurb.Bin316]